jgi:hypothetical protein
VFTKLPEQLKVSDCITMTMEEDGCIDEIFDKFVKEEASRRQWVITEEMEEHMVDILDGLDDYREHTSFNAS